jgi:hypothetical protein
MSLGKVGLSVNPHVRMCFCALLGCLGGMLVPISAMKAETPTSLNGAQQQTGELLKRVRGYVSGGGVDLLQEATLAKRLSEVLRDDKLQGLTREERRRIYRDVMLGAGQMRFHMLGAYPQDQAAARQYGSLGVVLFLRAMGRRKHQMKAVGPKKWDAEVLRAVDIMIREAWLFSRPARDFLFLVATESIPGLGADVEAQIVRKVRVFYTEAGRLGRREENGHLVRLQCRLAKTSEERLKLWDGLAAQKAYRLLLRESLRHGGFDRLAKYWEQFMQNQRLRRAQSRLARNL